MCAENLCCGSLNPNGTSKPDEYPWGLNGFCGTTETVKVAASSSDPAFNVAHTQQEYDFKCGETGMKIVASLATAAFSAFLMN